MRMVVGTVGSGSVYLEHVLSQSIPGDGSNEQLDLPQLTGIIRSLASKAGVSGGEIVVGVGRSRVELRNIPLPMADANELPDMVRFTALRQFANVGDTWPIDFAPLPRTARSSEDDASEMQEVIAMTINPALVSQIRKACSDAGFTVTQIGLRPMASGTLASAVSNSPVGSNSTVLLIDMLADEADMVVLEKGYVSFMRSVRLPTSEDGIRGPMPIGEIRRTLIAAVNARPGLKIDRIVLWSDPATAKSSLAAWQPNLDVPVDAIDPLVLVEMKKSAERPNDTGRFAPLIGLLLQRKLSPKSVPANTFIDFLHPRQKMEKKKPVLQYALAATFATLVVGGGLWWYRSAHLALDSEIQELTQKFAGMDPELKLAKKYSDHWKIVERFLSGDIQWLDELSFLSKQSLPSDQMILEGTTTISVNTLNQGELKTHVKIIDQNLEPKLEELFRDKSHKVVTKGLSKSRDATYGWTFDPEILIEPAKVIDPTTLPPPKPAPKPAPKTEKKAETETMKEEAAPTIEQEVPRT